MELKNLTDYIVNGKFNEAVELVKDAVASGISPSELINQYLIKGMEQIGLKYEEGKAFIPHLLLSARAMKGCLEILKPLMVNKSDTSLATVVIGTVQGDLHDIGKNLVASMLEGCGFEVYDLGVNVSDSQFVEAVKEHNAKIVCMSALLTTTMKYMKTVVDTFISLGLKDKVLIMVGGAPLNQSFADNIGADGFSNNAYEAVELAKRLIK